MIKATITDRAAIGTLEREKVVAYLECKGWKEVGHFSRVFGRCPILQQDEDCDSIVIPHPLAGDYISRMADILQTVSRNENRSQLDIFSEMGGDLGIS